MLELEMLNEQQKEAVITTEGPVIVLAGAGTGKTRVLTNRIAYLIQNAYTYPYNILAVTFTNKAAREMKERIAKLVDVDVNNMWVSTFHSFCARVLRYELVEFDGYRRGFMIIDDDDRVKILREIIKEMNLDAKEFKPNYYKSKISSIKNYLTDNRMIEDSFSSHNALIDERIIEKYDKRLKKENLLDFDDLIYVTLRFLKANPNILTKYQERFKYILVDEFQDTNNIQYELVSLLAKKYQNIFVVGDQDQSIYAFRGANVLNIDTFMKDYPNYKMILLEENYRSTMPILKIANNVISNNKSRVVKNLFTNKKDDTLPAYYKAQTGYEEVMYVAEKINELIKNGYSYSDIAVLFRANHLSRNLEDAFVKYKIPYVVYGGKSFFERKEIKDMIAYLKLIIDYNDDFQFKRVVNEPKRKIGDALLSKLNAAALEHNCSLFKAIDYIQVNGIGVHNLLEFKFTILELMEELENKEMPFIEIIDKILSKTGYDNMLKEEGEGGLERIDNINEFKSALAEIEDFYEGDRRSVIEEFLSDIALRTNDDDKDESAEKVKLMTYHQAKGLEYKVVFMIAMEEGIFPSYQSINEDYSAEEERRICYVGITRARERLFISNVRSRMYIGRQDELAPSRFIKEMGEDNLDVVGRVVRTIMPEKGNSDVPAQESTSNGEINVGDKINHKLFGDGMVVEKNGKIISVAFASPHGIKKLMADHPSIRKI